MVHDLFFVGLLLMKAVGMVISSEMPSQCHAADGTTYLQTHHRRKMGDDRSEANRANHTNGFACIDSGACCFSGDFSPQVNMQPLQNGCGDVCCGGVFSCRSMRVRARSASCELPADFDNFCGNADITANDTVQCLGGDTCPSANVIFTGTTSPSCLKCEGNSACQFATVTADADKSLQITCSGQNACTNATVTVGGDACLQITCSGTGACFGMTVNVMGTSTCYYTATAGANTLPSGCKEATATDKCPGSCPTPACCTGFASQTGDGECSNVGQCEADDACTTTTTTTTSTSTATPPTPPTPPYNRDYFRRARRARRRNRRQHQEHFGSQ